MNIFIFLTVNIFCISVNFLVFEKQKLFIKEGYSRPHRHKMLLPFWFWKTRVITLIWTIFGYIVLIIPCFFGSNLLLYT